MTFAPTDFRRLIEEHQRMVFSIALRVTGEYGTAEEVAQDVFLELHKGIANEPAESTKRVHFESEDHIRFWLRRVAVHRATDALRRAARQPAVDGDEWLETDYAPDSNAAVPPAVEARLEDLLQSLPETLRVAIVLRYQEDMLPDEIATLLNQPLATVKSHLQRGLQLLRRKAATTLKEYIRD